MMALDAKSIKEEIPDKDIGYETNMRRSKGKEHHHHQCRTPDSPESARAIAPRSPISPPQSTQSMLLSMASTINSCTGTTTTTTVNSTALPAIGRTRNGRSISPLVNGNGSVGSVTPPLTSSQQQQQQQQQPPTAAIAATATPHAVTPTLAISALQDNCRVLLKLRRFLGALVQFGQDNGTEIGERVRALVMCLASGGMSTEEFKLSIQEATNFPLRPYVLPFLKSHVPLLQRDIASLARATNQSTMQYVRTNEASYLEYVHNPAEHSDIFLPMESSGGMLNGGGGGGGCPPTNGLLLKRRSSENYMDTHCNGAYEWPDYGISAAKRAHLAMNSALALSSGGGGGGGNSGNGMLFAAHQPTIFDYSNGPSGGQHEAFGGLMDKAQPNANSLAGAHRDDHRSGVDTAHRGGGRGVSSAAAGAGSSSATCGGDEEWKNIHTMLTCISAMVEKTKRAITILQQRGVDTTLMSGGGGGSGGGVHNNGIYADVTLNEMKRQTEEKVAEFRRNAEEAVNQVKRQAVIEIQRAVSAAENRAIEVLAQERIKMEKIFAEMSKSKSDGLDNGTQSPTTSLPVTSNVIKACWNCGRKANETCSGCSLARYCGSFCQHKDWEQHHQICGQARIENAQQKHLAAAIISRPVVLPARTSPAQLSNQTSQPVQTQSQQPASSNSIQQSNVVQPPSSAAAAAAAAAAASNNAVVGSGTIAVASNIK